MTQLDILDAIAEAAAPVPAWKTKHSLGPRPAAVRFWEKVDLNGAGGCWLWEASLFLSGYGQFQIGHTKIRAHRWAYEREFGPVPDGMVLDHLCRVRRCVNPAHLEAVTERENVLRGEGPSAHNARKTQCINRHPFDHANTRRTPNGKRVCRRCHAIRQQRRRDRLARAS